jgi:signal transduction histidine kinase
VSQPGQARAARDRTAEQIRRIRRSRIRRERLASVSLGVALPVAAFFLELGLDKNVASYPYFVLSFIAILLATVMGGPLGGIVAAVSSWFLNTFVLSERVPAEAIRPILDGINSGLAFVIGLALLEARKRPIRSPLDELTPRRSSRVPPEERRARTLTAAIEDFAGSRSTAQIADSLARRLVEATGAGWVAVFVRPRADQPLSLRATAGASPPGLPDQLAAAADSAGAGLGRASGGGGLEGTLTIPILVGQEVIGAALLGTSQPALGSNGAPGVEGAARPSVPRVPAGGSAQEDAEAETGLRLDSETGATAIALARLAGSAIERDRLVARGRAASDAASDATGRVTSFSRLASQLAGAFTVDSVCELLVEHAVSELRAEFGLAYAADRRNRSFVLVHARGYPVGLVQREARLPADVDGPVVRAARIGRPVEIGSPEAWRREFPSQSDLPAMTGMRSLAAWPLGDVERRGGVLVVGWAVSGAIDARSRELLSAMADQGGQALERASLHAREREAQQLQEAFISVISHELRTPITTILAGSRLLRRQLDDATTAGELAADVEAEADRLFRIVEDLLVLSRLERRNLSIAQEPVHLVHLIERVIASEARRWPTHTFVVPDSVPPRLVGVVRGEETYIEQVLRNLLANAAKYSPSGSTVEVKVDNEQDGVAVRVLDEGPGIARAEVEQLFSLFYRSPATAASAAGAGIGLFVSRQLVDAMGGRMWARPRRKGGSEFGFSLAAYPYDEEEASISAESDDGAATQSGGQWPATPGRTRR